ncbi:MAG: phosphatase PAP2 family protein [Usitatibacter sp.]
MEEPLKEKPPAADLLQIKRPRDIRFWIAMAVLGAAAIAFSVIARSVVTVSPVLNQDLQVSVWLHTHGNPVFTAFLYAITQVHSPVGISILSIVLACFLWRHGDRFWVLSLAVAVPGGMLLNTLLKHVYARARPKWDDPLLTALTTDSFPSGHAAGATLFYGFLAAYMVWRMKRGWPRALAVLGCALMVALVGFSRIYLGVHYLSDVLAAVSMSTVWLVLSLIVVRAYAKHRSALAGG